MGLKKKVRKADRVQSSPGQELEADRAAPPRLAPSRFQRLFFIGSISLFAVWFAYLVYVALWK